LSEVIIRDYREEDFSEILNFYHAHPLSVPSFSRDGTFLRHCLSFPGLESRGILIAFQGTQVVGIALVVVEENKELIEARIIELRGKSLAVTQPLIQRALQYCRERQADRVWVKAPPEKGIDKALRNWIETGKIRMIAKLQDPVPLLRLLLQENPAIRLFSGKVLFFDFGNVVAQCRVEADSISTVNLDRVTANPEIVVKMTAKTFLEIAFGVTSPYRALLTGKMGVQGLRFIPCVLKLMSSIKMGAPHCALVDHL
jgi:hypothetical protein